MPGTVANKVSREEKRIAIPNNPLASPSRAVISFYSSNKQFVDGDLDKIRFLDNEHTPPSTIESSFPVFESIDNPVFVRDATMRESFTNVWVDEDKIVDLNQNPALMTIALSIKSKSVDKNIDWLIGNSLQDVVKDIPSTGTYYKCELPISTKIINDNLSYGVKNNKIPKCIGKFYNMKSLVLDNHRIRKIENVDRLVKLERLSLHNNEIEKIENLDTLVNLKSLALSRNKIGKIEGLDMLANIELLDLNGNNINKIEGLDTLDKLRKLELINNNISKIEGLGAMKNLIELKIGRNHITKIEGLDGLDSLEKIMLWENHISRIEGVNSLGKLKRLDLGRNKVDKKECIAFRKKMPGYYLLHAASNDRALIPAIYL